MRQLLVAVAAFCGVHQAQAAVDCVGKVEIYRKGRVNDPIDGHQDVGGRFHVHGGEHRHCWREDRLITSVHLAQQHVDKVFVEIAGEYSASQPEPGCSTGSSSWDFMLDISQPTGKAIYSQLMAAQYARVPIQVVGSGSCTHPNYENLSYIVVEN